MKKKTIPILPAGKKIIAADKVRIVGTPAKSIITNIRLIALPDNRGKRFRSKMIYGATVIIFNERTGAIIARKGKQWYKYFNTDGGDGVMMFTKAAFVDIED